MLAAAVAAKDELASLQTYIAAIIVARTESDNWRNVGPKVELFGAMPVGNDMFRMNRGT